MNNDTINAVNDILKHGYYFQGQTLGDGGWPFLSKHGVDNWNHYVINLPDNQEDDVIAKDDQTAIAAFNDKYNLAGEEYAIYQMEVTFRTVFES